MMAAEDAAGDTTKLAAYRKALDAAETSFVETFLGVLWDIGLEIGHELDWDL